MSSQAQNMGRFLLFEEVPKGHLGPNAHRESWHRQRLTNRCIIDCAGLGRKTLPSECSFNVVATHGLLPLRVDNVLLIEPTEIVAMETIDEVVWTIISLVEEVEEDAGISRMASYTTPMQHSDEVSAACNPAIVEASFQ